MPKALIIGIDSTIGQALKKRLIAQGWSVFGTSRREENLNDCIWYLDLAQVSAFQPMQPIDVVYLCAGMTKISDCQDDPMRAHLINVEAPIELAHYFLKQGVQVVYVSSNAVFSGEKSHYTIEDNPCPVTRYGAYKVAVEEALLPFSNQVSIVRLTKVLTPDYPLILQWAAALKKNEVIHPLHPYYVSPVSIDVVVACLQQVVEQQVYGLIHLSGSEDATYLDVATYLAHLMGVSHALVVVKEAEGRKPMYASLDMTASSRVVEGIDLSFMATMDGLYKQRFTGDLLSR